MDLAWFIYTVFILLSCVVAITTSLIMWMFSSKRSWCLLAGIFSCYLFEQLLIFYSEYIGEKPFLNEYFIHGLEFPFANVLSSSLLFCLIACWASMRIHKELTKAQVAILFAGYLILSGLLAPVGGTGSNIKSLLFWLFRDASYLVLIAYCAISVHKNNSEYERLDVVRRSKVWITLTGLCMLMFAEDTFFVGFFNAETLAMNPSLHSFFWHLTERNMTENVICIFISCALVISSKHYFQVFAQRAPSFKKQADNNNLQITLEGKLELFAARYNMSDREAEIAKLMLEDKSAQEIAQALYISLGTVKSHQHHIYSKAGVNSRPELINVFWKS